MRYTTLIDISEIPAVYRNINVRLLYLHLCLKAGYHDTDRDVVDTSIRRLSADVGLTVSATRHALGILIASKLVTKQGNTWIVKKWLLEGAITRRPRQGKTARVEAMADARAEQQRLFEKQLQEQEKLREESEKTGKSSFMRYYESLLERAKNGDLEAAQLAKRHEAMYLQHLKNRADGR